MLKKMFFMFVFLVVSLAMYLFPDVPPGRTHQPNVPYFLDSMNLQTVEMHIFPAGYSGMVIDSYADLTWNPAYILRQSKKSIYLDYNRQNNPYSQSVPVFSQYDSYDFYYSESSIQPGWYPQTTINTVQTSPLYHLAAIIPLSSKVAIGFINRSIYDYGAFRSIPSYAWRDKYWESEYLDENVIPQRLDIDENHRKVFGNQSEIVLGVKLSKKIDLGFRLGHYTYNSDGDLYDSRFGTYPHSSFDNLNDESFKIKGHHVEAGMGMIFSPGKNTRAGFFIGLTRGKSSEDIISKDNRDTWSERDTNPVYYDTNQRFLESGESYSCKGKKPNITITFEQDISRKLILRSFFSYTWRNLDTSGSKTSSEQVFQDLVYDEWYQDNTYLRQREFNSNREYGLNGTEKIRTNQWKGFASLIFIPKKDWVFFGGIQIQNDSYKQEIDESSGYIENGLTEYRIFQPGSFRYFHSYEKIYTLEANYRKWTVSLPVGINARIYKGLHLLLGTDIILSFTDEDSQVNLLYPEKITRRWKNNVITVNDEEINRREEYISDPAMEFSKSSGVYFGLVYQFSFGGKLFFRSQGDIFQTSNWALGFEMSW